MDYDLMFVIVIKVSLLKRNWKLISELVSLNTFMFILNFYSRKMIHEPFKKDYSCDFCGAQFCTNKQLSRHRAYYHLKKLACTFKDCDKSFISKSLLERHLNTHTGNRDQFCHLCEKSYFKVRDLKRHLDVTHKQTTYFCEFCSYTNSRKDYLGNHLKSAHNLDAEARSEILKTVKFVKNSV